MPYNKPTEAFSGILSSSTLSRKTSLNSIIKDVKRSNPDLTASQRLKIGRTIKKLNTDPNAIVTNIQTKSIVEAMGDAGHLKSRYRGRAGAAIKQVQKAHKELTGDTSGKSSWRSARITEKFQKKHGQKDERLKESRLRRLARERRAEADAENEIKEGSLEYQKWKSASSSVADLEQKKDKTQVSTSEDDQGGATVSTTRPEESKGVIDMAID